MLCILLLTGDLRLSKRCGQFIAAAYGKTTKEVKNVSQNSFPGEFHEDPRRMRRVGDQNTGKHNFFTPRRHENGQKTPTLDFSIQP
jgi:hypothetical protein